MHANPFFTKAALSFIPGSTGEAAFMVAAGAVTKPVLFVGSFVAKPLMFAGQKAFNSSAKFLGLSSAKEAKVAYNAANAANSGKAEGVFFSVRGGASAAHEVGSSANKLTKGQIVEYLQNVDKIPMKQLTQDMEKIGFKFLYENTDKKIYKFSHVKNNLRIHEPNSTNPNVYKINPKAKSDLESSKVIIEIHCDKPSGPHIHITDAKGNVYDKYLNNLTEMIAKKFPNKDMDAIIKKSERLPEAHIKIKEFVKLNMRPENV